MICACAPAPVRMTATEASELLARFASGSEGAEVCTPEGRALLRGAVRAYGAEMAMAGVSWPMIPAMGADANRLTSLDVSVTVAFTAGFVEASDFYGPARALVSHLTFAHWPQVRSMRRGAHVACAEVVQLQQAAAHVVLESERYRDLSTHARNNDDRLRRQARRLERAQEQMNDRAAAVEARLREAQT